MKKLEEMGIDFTGVKHYQKQIEEIGEKLDDFFGGDFDLIDGKIVSTIRSTVAWEMHPRYMRKELICVQKELIREIHKPQIVIPSRSDFVSREPRATIEGAWKSITWEEYPELLEKKKVQLMMIDHLLSHIFTEELVRNAPKTKIFHLRKTRDILTRPGRGI